MTKPSCS